MRCPKCHYLSFDPEPRCKNCGYDLEGADADLAFKAAEEYSDDAPDLELRRDSDVTPPAVTLELQPMKPVVEAPVPIKSERFADLVSSSDEAPLDAPALISRDLKVVSPKETAPVLVPMFAPAQAAAPQAAPPQIETAKATPVATAVAVEPEPPAPAPSSPTPTTEMPLFVRENAPARPPLSVRRTVTDLPKAKSRVSEPPRMLDRRVGPLDHDLLEDLRRVEREEAVHTRIDVRSQPDIRARVEASAAIALEASDDLEESGEIPASQRLAAASLDGLLLGGIGTFVLWATLRLTGAGLTALGTASLIPFGIFLTGVCVAYLLMFTLAGGQTLGKMLMGLRVVCDEDAGGARLTLGQASLRAVIAPFSVMALGLGWMPVLFGRGLALHDRLAHTRVVRA